MTTPTKKRPRRRSLRPTHWIGKRSAAMASGSGYDTQRGTSLRQYRSHSQTTAEWAEATPTTRTEIRETSRALDRSNPVYQRILNAYVENVVARGPRVTPNTADPGWNAAAADIYRQACTALNFSPNRLHDEHTASEIVARSRQRDGGILAYHPLGATQLFEDGQIVTPRDKLTDTTVRDGIQFDANGAVRGYWVGPYSRYGIVDTSAATLVPAWHTDTRYGITLPRATYLHSPRFASQLRGISTTSGASDHLERGEQYWEALLERAINEACVFGTLNSVDPSAAANSISAGRGNDTSNEPGQAEYSRPAYLEPNTIFNLAAEDKFQLHAAPTPNAQFENVIKMGIRMASITLAMPLELVLIMFEHNFSASRAAIEIFKMFARKEKKYMVDRWTRWHYHWAIYDAMLLGDLPYRPDWQSVIIAPDGWSYLDPKADALAVQYRFNSGEGTMTEILADTGRDVTEHYQRRANDYTKAADVAKATGVPIEILAPHLFAHTPPTEETPEEPTT